MAPDYTGSVRQDGPTPAGGAYAVLVYVDGKCVEIAEYDAADQLVLRSYAAD